MSRETLTHLNTQTLIGYTSKRGRAWHYRVENQETEPNHYEHRPDPQGSWAPVW